MNLSCVFRVRFRTRFTISSITILSALSLVRFFLVLLFLHQNYCEQLHVSDLEMKATVTSARSAAITMATVSHSITMCT